MTDRHARRNMDVRRRELARAVYETDGTDPEPLLALLALHQRSGSLRVPVVVEPDEFWIVLMIMREGPPGRRRESRREILCVETGHEAALAAAVEHGVRQGRQYGWLHGASLGAALHAAGAGDWGAALIEIEDATRGVYEFRAEGPYPRCQSRRVT